jgi:hypothetical protein
MKKGFLIIIFSFLCLISCKKELSIDIDPNFEGGWFHYESTTKFKYLSIDANSKGYIYYSQGWSVIGDTQTRTWSIKKGNLLFGWAAVGDEKFEINQFPTIADSVFISDADTIELGDMYMVLDEIVFKQ